MSDDTDTAPNLRDVTMRDGELTPTGTGQIVVFKTKVHAEEVQEGCRRRTLLLLLRQHARQAAAAVLLYSCSTWVAAMRCTQKVH